MGRATIPWWLAAGLAVLLFVIGIFAGGIQGREYRRALAEAERHLSAADAGAAKARAVAASLVSTAGYLGNEIVRSEAIVGSLEKGLRESSVRIANLERINRETEDLYRNLAAGFEAIGGSAGTIGGLAEEGAGIVDDLIKSLAGPGP